MKQAIIKLEDERKKYLAKEWEEFYLVKNLLIQKRKSKSKSKEPIQKDSLFKLGSSNAKNNFVNKA